MSDLDEFLKWVARQRQDGLISIGYGELGAAIDIYRAERATGREYRNWVDAYEALHPLRSDERKGRKE